MANLTDLTIAEAQAGLAQGDFSSREITEAHITAIESARDLNAFVTETPERALADAEASDKRRAGGDVGALDGLPIAIKDLFCTKGVQSTASSHMLEGFIPPYESTVSSKMVDAGMVMLGNSRFSDARKIKGIRFGYVKGNPSVNVKTDAIAAFAGLKEGEWGRVWHGGYGVMKTALLTGKIDAFLAAPTSGFSKEIEASPNGISWLQFEPGDKAAWDRMLKIAPMYGPLLTKAGAGISEAKPSQTLSFRYPMMVTYADRNFDEVYAMVKAMDEMYPQYKNVSYATQFWNLKDASTPPCEAAFHPASVKYFKEKGVWSDASQKWQDARLARHAAVIDAWDDAQDSYNEMRAAERAKGNKIKSGAGWAEWWTKVRKEKGL